MKKRKKSLFSFYLILLSLCILFASKYIPGFAENIFSLHIYHWISQLVSLITRLVPFSIMEWSLVIFLCLLPILTIAFIYQLFKKKGERILLLKRIGWGGLQLFSIVLFWFTITCGVNYYRYEFTTYSGLVIERSTKEELYNLCNKLIDEANILRSELSEGEDGIVKFHFNSYKEMSDIAAKSMKDLSKKYPVLKGNYPGPKSIVFSKVMSKTQLTGIYCNFTMEANVNVDVLDYTIPVTMCHELSHLRGFMREDEANYIGYLACTFSDNKEFQYSGVMSAFAYTINRLYKEDKNLYDIVKKKCSEGVWKDYIEEEKYWKPYQGKIVSKVSNKVNDVFLKINSQEDGVKSYGRMVDLLLAQNRLSKTNKEGN